MELAKNDERVILAYNDNEYAFDDQYSMLLWGKLTLGEFSGIIKRINKCTIKSSSQLKRLCILKGIILTMFGLSFFILPGVMATAMKSYVSAIVLAAGGASGILFFINTILFVYFQRNMEIKIFNGVKRVLAEINIECRDKGLNWRLIDSQLIEFEATYGAGTLGNRPNTVSKCTPQKWIEIEVNYTMNLYEYRVPVETIEIQPKSEYLI